MSTGILVRDVSLLLKRKSEQKDSLDLMRERRNMFTEALHEAEKGFHIGTMILLQKAYDFSERHNLPLSQHSVKKIEEAIGRRLLRSQSEELVERLCGQIHIVIYHGGMHGDRHYLSLADVQEELSNAAERNSTFRSYLEC